VAEATISQVEAHNTKVLVGLQVDPPVQTPNGDAINDDTRITYTILHLLEPTPTRVSVHDLQALRIARAHRIGKRHTELLLGIIEAGSDHLKIFHQ